MKRAGFVRLRESVVRWESGKPASGFPLFHRFVVGLWGMWESRSDFQGLWKAGCAFHQSVISTGVALFGRGFQFGFLSLLDTIARNGPGFRVGIRR